MDMLLFGQLPNRSVMCCELIMKIKQYINILEVEVSRLNNLQLESNQILDQFYKAKNEFDFQINEMQPIKYAFNSTDPANYEQKIEFSNFFNCMWQIGKHKFLEKQKKLCYFSVVGCPLTEILSTVQSFIEDVMHRLNYMPYHSECRQALHFMSSQIAIELQEGILNTADACFRQCCYLKAAQPFLEELNNLIHNYILQPNNFNPKQFVDTVMFQIPSVDSIRLEEDCAELAPFRQLVDLLNGKLLDHDFLDQHSEIRPIVDDDSNLKKSKIVKEAVNWVVKKVRIEHDDSIALPNLPLIYFPQGPERKQTSRNNSLSPSIQFRSPMQISPQSLGMAYINSPSDKINSNWGGFAKPMPHQPKFTRKSRKSMANNNDADLQYENDSDDLKPINLHAIQTPLIAPLL